MRHLLLVLLLLLSLGCSGNQGMRTMAYDCLGDVIGHRHNVVCNNHDLQRWENWKQKNPYIGEQYERDLFSGKLYNKKAGPAPPHAYDSPNFACPRDWWHWCLD